MKPANTLLMLAASGMGLHGSYLDGTFSGRQKCKNPGCRTWTMSSEFCCLSCAVEAKRKRIEKEENERGPLQ